MRQTRNATKVSKYLEESGDEEEAFLLKKKSKSSRQTEKSIPVQQNKKTQQPNKRLKKMSDSEDYQPDVKDDRESDHKVDISDAVSVSISFSGQEDTPKKKGTSQPRKRQQQSKQKGKKIVIKKKDSEEEDVQGEDNHQFFQEKSGNADQFTNAEKLLPYFIQDGYVKDEEGRQPGEDQYDPSTLHIPIQDFQKQSPMFRQYWNAKKKNYDKVVFFRFGRWLHCFYRDAILIGQLFGAKNVGFWGKERPVLTIYDSQYPIYLRGLLERGYKICVIEQIEKGEISQRDKGEIAQREVSQLISIGTWQDLDDDMSYDARYLMTIIEDQAPQNQKGYKYVYGIALVDSTTNEIFLDQFYDDEHSNNLRALLVKTKPLEVIVQQGNLNDETEKLIKNVCQPIFFWYTKEFKNITHILNQFKQEFMDKSTNQIQKEFKGIVIPQEEFQADVEVQVDLNDGLYEDGGTGQKIQFESSVTLSEDYPDLLQELEKQFYFERDTHLKSISKELSKLSEQELEEVSKTHYSYFYAVQALYTLQFYLRKLMLSSTVYRRGIFSLIDTNFVKTNNLYLDSQALESLEIFQVDLQTKVQEKGSLFHYVNKCGSNFGKRLLKKWLSEPLFNIQKLQERQDSVRDLVKHIEVTDEFNKRVRTLPDFERQITKIFNSLQPQRLKMVSFTGDTFGQSRLKELSQLLKQLKVATTLIQIFASISHTIQSKRLRRLLKVKKAEQETKQIQKRAKPAKKSKKGTKIEEESHHSQQDEEIGLFPDINAALEELEQCLEIKDGVATPRAGLSVDYDKAQNAKQDVENQLTQELNHYKRVLKCEQITYSHGKLKYQLEVPEEYVEGNKKPKELIITSKKKGYQRFQSEKIENLIFALKQQEEEINKSLIPFFEEYFQKFYTFKHLWLQLTACLQELDCLCALAIVSSSMKVKCLPKFIQDDETDTEVFNLEGAIHPCLMEQMPHVNWVANDIMFKKNIDALLLTGYAITNFIYNRPNMSGKSTLLRLTAIHIILAQIGCYVPASSFTLRPFDRIFCRIGASDRLLEGKSTFFIEMEETKTILDQCTSRSLVIVDELGRGTSTYDGVAIASAVLRHLVTKLLPKTLFATHYHILLDEFALHKNIKNTVMKHYYDETSEEVHFTYKLVEGQADKSFAANVARIAGLPKVVIKRAVEVEKKITKEEDKLTINRDIVKKFNQVIQGMIDHKN